jgi:hypothetical protein
VAAVNVQLVTEGTGRAEQPVKHSTVLLHAEAARLVPPNTPPRVWPCTTYNRPQATAAVHVILADPLALV